MSIACSKGKWPVIILISLGAFLPLSCGEKPSSKGLPQDSIPDTLPWQDSLIPPPDSHYVELGPGLLIDDFERGAHNNLLFGYWFTFDDLLIGGNSTITNRNPLEQLDFAVGDNAFYSRRSLQIDFLLNSGSFAYEPFVGFGTGLPATAGDSAFDGSTFGAIAYWYRGSAHLIRLETGNVLDQDWYQYEIPATDQWRRAWITFSQLRQEGWGLDVPFDALNLQKISWQIRGNSGQRGTLFLDNIYLALLNEQRSP